MIDTSSINTLTAVDTCIGPCPVVSLGSYKLSLTESNFNPIFFISSFDGFDDPVLYKESEFPSYPSFPLDDCCGLFLTPDHLNDKEKELLRSLIVNVIEANKIEEKTRDQADCKEWKRERKLRFIASNFGNISRRQRYYTRFVEDLLAQKAFSSAAVVHGKKYEPEALKEYEKYMRKSGKPVKVSKRRLFVSPKSPILQCRLFARCKSY